MGAADTAKVAVRDNDATPVVARADIPARSVADRLYALANRTGCTVYTRDVVQRLDPANDAVVAACHRALP